MAEPHRGDESDPAAYDRHEPDLSQHHAAHTRGRGAKRHAQADFARPLRHSVGKYAAQSNRREPRRQRRKAGREHADEAIEEHILAHLLRHRAQVLDRQRRIDARDDLRNRLTRQTPWTIRAVEWFIV
jgi:hypothetical protein